MLILIGVLSCRENRSDSGVVARIAGEAIGADTFLPNMGTEEFLSCLSRPALEGACKDTSVLPRQRVKDTRAALVKHFAESRFVHPSRVVRSRRLRRSQLGLSSDDTSGRRTTKRRRMTSDVQAEDTRRRTKQPATASPKRRNSDPASPSEQSPPPALEPAAVSFLHPPQEDIMSAQSIYDLLRSARLIRYSDGTPRPPQRFKHKLAAWENNNSGGRLVRKTAPRDTLGNHSPASFTLHQGDFGSAGVVVLRSSRPSRSTATSTFIVTERPKPGIGARSRSRRRGCRAAPSRRRPHRGASLARATAIPMPCWKRSRRTMWRQAAGEGRAA